jgi:Acetyltransferase (GNAT) domain
MAIMHPGPHLDFSRVGADGIGMDGIERLRYEVYCLECGFLDPADYLDRREQDEYDGYSVHLAGFNSEGDVIASLRLVRDSPLGFPLEAHSKELHPEFQDLPRDGRLRSRALLLPSDIAAARMTAAMVPTWVVRRWRLVRGAIQTSAGANIH